MCTVAGTKSKADLQPEALLAGAQECEAAVVAVAPPADWVRQPRAAAQALRA